MVLQAHFSCPFPHSQDKSLKCASIYVSDKLFRIYTKAKGDNTLLNKICYSNLKEREKERKKETRKGGIKGRREESCEVVIQLKTFKNNLVTIIWNDDISRLNVQFSLNKFSYSTTSCPCCPTKLKSRRPRILLKAMTYIFAYDSMNSI